MNYIIPHYYDASVASKIFTREEGWEEVEQFVLGNHNHICWITEFVFYEILGVIKSKWKKGKKGDDYYNRAVNKLFSWIEGDWFRLDSEFSVRKSGHYLELREMVKKYNIDYSDGLQIISVKYGKYRNYTHYSCPVLVSADKDLLKAAVDYGVRTWHFGREEHPSERS